MLTEHKGNVRVSCGIETEYLISLADHAITAKINKKKLKKKKEWEESRPTSLFI